ncbi:hypothetical protein BC332_26230 [Capsicum chinense]|nr:hypothetical protein BC332_26230 [Capsicum chinense]
MGPGILPRHDGIALRHWKLTTLDLSLGAMFHNCGGPPDFDNYHFGMLRDALMAQHLDVILYYLKKYKNKNFSTNRYTTTVCFLKVYIDKVYVNYYNPDVGKELATQDAFARTNEASQMEMSLINPIKGLNAPAVISLKDQCIHMYDSMDSARKRTQTSEIQKLVVILPTYLQYNNFFEQKVPTDWAALESYKGKTKHDSFLMEYASRIAQQNSESLDCSVFVVVYAEYLSKGLGIQYLGIDVQYHFLRYASLLCKYGSKKSENGYFSENEDPPRPMSGRLYFNDNTTPSITSCGIIHYFLSGIENIDPSYVFLNVSG